MIVVKIPDNYLPERKYVIDVIFNEILGLEYSLEVTTSTDYHYRIIIENNNILTIKDHFFSASNNIEDYPFKKNIPDETLFINNPFISEKDIPVIYGNDELSIGDNEIICGIDVFASSFFMLSRWEEYVNKERDAHNRFPAEQSVAFKNNFLHRPVVNEYVEMLWNMLLKLGVKEKRKDNHFQLIPTHDIDMIHFPVGLLNMASDIIRTKGLSTSFKRFIYAVRKNNFYDSFDWLMDVSEKNNLTSHFYFLNKSHSSLDAQYSMNDNFVLTTINKIKERNHVIGIHGGYLSYNNHEIFSKEKKLLEQTHQITINEGRQHFLRFDMPDTWQLWENNCMKTDSTLGYAAKEGFRCGTGNEYSVFNILTREKLTLKERPLILMDTTLQHSKYQGKTIEEARETFGYYKETCKKYKMPYTVLFHNSSFEPLRWKGWKDLYEEVMK